MSYSKKYKKKTKTTKTTSILRETDVVMHLTTLVLVKIDVIFILEHRFYQKTMLLILFKLNLQINNRTNPGRLDSKLYYTQIIIK